VHVLRRRGFQLNAIIALTGNVWRGPYFRGGLTWRLLPELNGAEPVLNNCLVDGCRAMRTAVVLAGIMLTCLVRPAGSQEWTTQEWTTFVEPQFGTRLEFPSEVFTVHEGSSVKGIGEEHITSDGRAALAVYSQRNLRREAPATYLKRNYKMPRRAMDYVRVTRTFFAVSAVNEGTIYYSRCNFSRRSATIHCFDLKYPASEKREWDDIVTRISRSLGPLDRG
jgi:hypothetical protein